MKRRVQNAPEFAERRRCERVDLKLLVIGQCLGTEGDLHPFQGETRNVSLEGFCLKLDNIDGYTIGQKVSFRTRLYRGDSLIKGHGRVCWVLAQPAPPWPVKMGVMLTSMRQYRRWYERVEEEICRFHRSV